LPCRRRKRAPRLLRSGMHSPSRPGREIRALEGSRRQFQPEGSFMTRSSRMVGAARMAMVTLALLLAASPAFAQLRLDVTRGKVEPMPIAIPHFAGFAYTTTRQNWRRIAHIIADEIYKRITGEDGYFDTRIVYIAESGPAERREKRLALMDQDGANHQYLTDGRALVLTPRFSP